MLSRDKHLRSQIYQIKDAAIFGLALWLAYWLRQEFDWLSIFEGHDLTGWKEFAWLYVPILPGAPLVLDMQGFYQRPLSCSRRLTAWLLLKGCALVTFGIILVMFFFKMQALSRFVILLFGVVSFTLLFVSEELIRVVFRSKFAQSQFKRRVLLVGSKEDTDRMRSDLKGAREEIEIVGELDLNKTSVSELVELMHDHSPNSVILNANHTYFGQVEKAIQACELEGVEACLVAHFFQTQLSRTSFDEFYGRPILVFRTLPEASWQGVAKLVLDFIGALLLILVFSPFFLIATIAIKTTSRGPIFFRQQRCGLNGRPFTMLKFRSMVTDAEQQRDELERLNEMQGPVFKLTNDPRVTPVGKFLRKYSIDEFPQLFNVLRGEMSLVGPRPLPVSEVKRFDDPAHRRRLSVKPGLTCLWQVSGRNNLTSFRDWVRLDLEYIDNWTIWLDLKILWRTIPVVLAGTGAK